MKRSSPVNRKQEKILQIAAFLTVVLITWTKYNFLVWRKRGIRLFHKLLRWKLYMKFMIICLLFIDKNFYPHLSQHEKLGKHSFTASEWSQLLSKKLLVLFQEALGALSKSLEQFQEVSSSGWTEGAVASMGVSGAGEGGHGKESHRHFYSNYCI